MTFQKKFGKRPATIKSNSQDRESDARGQKSMTVDKRRKLKTYISNSVV